MAPFAWICFLLICLPAAFFLTDLFPVGPSMRSTSNSCWLLDTAHIDSASFRVSAMINRRLPPPPLRSFRRYHLLALGSLRGSGRVRQWLYLSALRLIRNEPRASKWYRRKLRKGGGGKRRLIMALTRKLALSMWAVSKSQQLFDVDRMLGPTGNKSVRKKAAGKQINRKQIHAKGAIKAKVH